MKSSKHKKIKASDFDAAFEKGDVSKHLDLKSAKARFPTQRISIDFPKNIIAGIDQMRGQPRPFRAGPRTRTA